MIQSILIEGLIYGLMVLGVFITFRILNFADMTVDGSFPLGACVMAALIVRGINPSIAILVAFLAGSLAGLVTAIIHSKLHIPGLLAGILTMTMLYSVNLRIMGNRANISLLKYNTIFNTIENNVPQFLNPDTAIVIILIIIVLIIKLLLDLFFHTDFGLCMGALGSNQQMIISQGMNPEIIKAVGICLANGLTGIAGAYAAMYQGFADVGSGTGVVVSGLASLMLGEFVLKSNKIKYLTLRVFIGSILYRALMFLGRRYGYVIGLTANDLKLITGALIIICLIITNYDFGAQIRKRKSDIIQKEQN
ncbi:MAG: ABC transporter permease [Treponema sp. CETP13]|nr:MAG: ABC transporter permease [Treponema sp. CETP13]